jgi:hypothetical protein
MDARNLLDRLFGQSGISAPSGVRSPQQHFPARWTPGMRVGEIQRPVYMMAQDSATSRWIISEGDLVIALMRGATSQLFRYPSGDLPANSVIAWAEFTLSDRLGLIPRGIVWQVDTCRERR